LLRPSTLSRWFRRRHGAPVDSLIEHPQRAALAQFIAECESITPGSEQVVQDVIEALYDFRSGGTSAAGRRHGPLLLLSAHSAKGLEFDHVVILDGGNWSHARAEERRLFYVAMTRARRTLTLCQSSGSGHAFIRDVDGLALRSRPATCPPEPRLAHRSWIASPEYVVLSWPGEFPPTAPLHRSIAALEVGSPLQLRPRSDGNPGWEVADAKGIAVTHMSRKFSPPAGKIVGVRVSAILARHAKDGERKHLRCRHWEVVLPEIEYLPGEVGL